MPWAPGAQKYVRPSQGGEGSEKTAEEASPEPVCRLVNNLDASCFQEHRSQGGCGGLCEP